MIRQLLSLFGVCQHDRISRVFSNMPGVSDSPYIICWNCMRRMSYDLETMKVGKEIPKYENQEIQITEPQ